MQHSMPRRPCARPFCAFPLQDALSSRLQPGVKDSPINDGLYSAMKLVDAFLYAQKESESDLEQLKAQVKRIMVDRVSHGALTAIT